MNEREKEVYSIHIWRKLLGCHQPVAGKHNELVCVAESGHNCLDMDIVSMNRRKGSKRGRRSGGSKEWL